MNADATGKFLIGALCGAVLVGALWMRERAEKGGVQQVPRTLPQPEWYEPLAPERTKAAVDIARVENDIAAAEKELAKPLPDRPDPAAERLKRGRALARALGEAVRGGWDSDAARKAEQAVLDFLDELRRDSAVDADEFIVSPERDALLLDFLEGLGLALTDDQRKMFDDLLARERLVWAERLEKREGESSIEQLAATYARAAEAETALGTLLDADQKAAWTHRFMIRARSRNIPPFRDRNMALGPRELRDRTIVDPQNAADLAWAWKNDLLGADRDPKPLESYAREYLRQMTAVEVPKDLSGTTSIPSSYRAAQLAAQAAVQKMMLADRAFTDEDLARIREWSKAYDPGRR